MSEEDFPFLGGEKEKEKEREKVWKEMSEKRRREWRVKQDLKKEKKLEKVFLNKIYKFTKFELYSGICLKSIFHLIYLS